MPAYLKATGEHFGADGMSPMTPNDQPDLLTEAQAAEYLSITPRTIRLWRNRRSLPFIKITNKCIRFRRRDIEAWLERSRTVIT